MEDVLALIVAFFKALKKRANEQTPLGAGAGQMPGRRVTQLGSLGRAQRAALAERMPGLGAALIPTGARDVRAVAVSPEPARSGLVGAPGFAAGPTVKAEAPASGVPATGAPEAGLVRALFATPQSLVAAFIVAEVLAKPVALREP